MECGSVRAHLHSYNLSTPFFSNVGLSLQIGSMHDCWGRTPTPGPGYGVHQALDLNLFQMRTKWRSQTFQLHANGLFIGPQTSSAAEARY